MQFKKITVQTPWNSPLGQLHLAASASGMAGIWFAEDPHRPDLTALPAQSNHPLLQRAMHQLDRYFAGQVRNFSLPLDLSSGTPFQQSVWRALLTLPYGQTTSYGALSQGMGAARATRAVGAAIGRNPLSIVIPCHRVLGADGSLTGYTGGLDNKVALLQLEGVLMA